MIVDSLGRLQVSASDTLTSATDLSGLQKWVAIGALGLIFGIVALALLMVALIALPLSAIASLWRLCIRRPLARLRAGRLSRMAL